MLRRNYVLFLALVGLVTTLAACSSPSLPIPDSGQRQAQDPSDASVGGQSGADRLEPPGPSQPALPTGTLEEYVDRASGVFVGTVVSVSVDAVVEEVRAAGLSWRIHSDIIEVRAERAIGTAGGPSLHARLIPVRCEAFDDQGQAVPGAVLSTCTGRDPGNSPAQNARVLGFLTGPAEVLTLVRAVPYQADGSLDVRGLDSPPTDTTERAVWALVETRWRALGR
jgi:hypothetical protein